MAMKGEALTAETLVIGAGVIGASIAAELQRDGTDVWLVDAGVPGEDVSGASFAWVNASPDKSPESYRLLNLYGLESHHQRHERGESVWFHPTGSLAIGLDGEGGPGTVYSISDDRESRAGSSDFEGRTPAEMVERSEIAQDFPYLADEVADAEWYPRDGWVDVRHMLFDLVSSLPRDRVLTTSCVVSVQAAQEGAGSTVTFADGTSIRARQVVLANGNGITPLIGVLRPGLTLLDSNPDSVHVGLVVETFPLEQPLTTVIRAKGVSLRPTREGGAVIADHATAASFELSDPALWDVARILVERAESLAPGLGKIRIRSVRISPRVWPLDGRTVCGWVTDGVYAVLTHSGITLAPYLAECVRIELNGGAVAELTDYRPARFMEGH